MKVVLKLRILATVLLLVSLLALAVSVGPLADAQCEQAPCAYTGLAFYGLDDSCEVPAGTPIRVLEDSTVLGETATGEGGLADNEFYLDSIIACGGTEVSFEVWHAGMERWLPASETAIHCAYSLVQVDLHAFIPTLHINVNPFLFVYPWIDCPLPAALTNIGPGQLDVVIIVWGTAEIEGEWQWVSYDPAIGAGSLGPLGLEEGLPYVMQVTGEGVCNVWEMCGELCAE